MGSWRAPLLLGLLAVAGCEGPGWRPAVSEAPELAVGFGDGSDRPRLEWPPPERTPPEPEPLTVATFNLQRFGPSKAGRPEVLAGLAAAIAGHALVAVQEITDISGGAPLALAATLEAQGAPHRMVLSERGGKQPDDRNFQEQYAFFYDPTRLALVGAGALFDDAADDHFPREPFVARFEALEGDLDLVFVDIHTSPSTALPEIAALHEVNGWAHARAPDATGVVTLGDFNAGCRYADPEDLDALAIRGPDYVWAVPDDADTNVAASSCAYDRIVFDIAAAAHWTGRWGVERSEALAEVSDHWPVWVELTP